MPQPVAVLPAMHKVPARAREAKFSQLRGVLRRPRHT
jgi:hypothetical protein